jgi:paraquat-inducible protein A
MGESRAATMTRPVATAASLGLAACQTCGLLSHGQDGSRCPRCATHLHSRKPYSISRTWSLLIAAMVLYVPANLLPMMHTSALFGSQSDTIMSGIAYFWNSGSWYLALIIFFASILVPMLKMIGLLVLLVSVQLRLRWQQDQRTRLYRLIDVIGRWSILDIYVVAIIVTLVRFGVLGSVEPGAGAAAFGAVVVLTLLAAMSFDPRLIWDASEHTDGRDAAQT